MDSEHAPVNPADLCDLQDLAKLLGYKPVTLRSMLTPNRRPSYRKLDGLPDPIRTCGQTPVWEMRAVKAWMSGRS